MRTRTHAFVCLAVIALLALNTQQALAEWIEIHLTPKNLDFHRRQFVIKTKDVKNGLKEFEVTVIAKERDFSPFADAQLTLIDDVDYVAILPVGSKRRGDKMTFWFRVAPKSLARSRFEYSESNYVPLRKPNGEPLRNAQGNQENEQLMGGEMYSFLLHEFVNVEKKDKTIGAAPKP